MLGSPGLKEVWNTRQLTVALTVLRICYNFTAVNRPAGFVFFGGNISAGRKADKRQVTRELVLPLMSLETRDKLWKM